MDFGSSLDYQLMPDYVRYSALELYDVLTTAGHFIAHIFMRATNISIATTLPRKL